MHARDERRVAQGRRVDRAEDRHPRVGAVRPPVRDRAVHLDDRAGRGDRERVVQRGDAAPVDVLGAEPTERAAPRSRPAGSSDRRGCRRRRAPRPGPARRGRDGPAGGPTARGPGRRGAPAAPRRRAGPGAGRPGARPAPGGRGPRARRARGRRASGPTARPRGPARDGSSSSPAVAEYPSLKTRYTTASTSSSRRSRSVPVGSSKVAPASLSVRFAREIRWPIAGLGAQVGAGDLGRGQPADQAEGQGRSGLRAQRRVAGQEDQPEDVVLDVVDLRVEIGHGCLVEGLGAGQLVGLATQVLRAAELVDAPPPGRGHQPPGGVGGDAVLRPLLQGRDQGVLGQVLGQADVPGHPGERRDEAGRLGPPRRGDRLGGEVRLRPGHAGQTTEPQASVASGGPSATCRMVATIWHSGQYVACSWANSCWPATASSTVS